MFGIITSGTLRSSVQLRGHTFIVDSSNYADFFGSTFAPIAGLLFFGLARFFLCDYPNTGAQLVLPLALCPVCRHLDCNINASREAVVRSTFVEALDDPRRVAGGMRKATATALCQKITKLVLEQRAKRHYESVEQLCDCQEVGHLIFSLFAGGVSDEKARRELVLSILRDHFVF